VAEEWNNALDVVEPDYCLRGKQVSDDANTLRAPIGGELRVIEQIADHQANCAHVLLFGNLTDQRPRLVGEHGAAGLAVLV
jgi:hypothetical protein